MSTIQLVYCRDNADLAEKLAHQLGRIGIPFHHLTNRPDDAPGDLAKQAVLSADPVLLILTDNFLRSTACMSSALNMYQTLVRQNRILVVTANGRSNVDGTPVPTQFDRVVHAIQYMNFWQTNYLDRNPGISNGSTVEKEHQEEELEIVRGIANEIGELFSALRDNGYATWEQFELSDYALFFRHFGLQEWHEQYRRLVALEYQTMPPIPEQAQPVPVAGIPAFEGILAPAPMKDENLTLELTEPVATNGANTGRHTTPVWEEPVVRTEPAQREVKEPPTEQSMLERLIDEPVIDAQAVESEIQQTIKDAWFWLEKGYTERGMDLLQLVAEQYPDHEALQASFEQAQAKYGKPEQEVPVEMPAISEEMPPEIQEEIPGPEQPAPPEQPEKPVADHSQEADSYHQMGENALAKGDYLLAKYCWDRVTELQPGYPGIYRKLALLTSNHLTDYKETAAHYLEEALLADTNDADLHYRLALLLRDHLEQPEQAFQHFRDAVVLEPEHADAWLALAEATLESGDSDQAETLYRHTIQLKPEWQTAALDARFLRAPAEPLAIAPAETPVEPPAEWIEPVAAPDEPEATRQPVPIVEMAAETLTVLITGASSGIGRATAELFARHGHRLILTGRREDRLEDLKQTLESDFKVSVLPLSFDVRNLESVRDALENLPEDWENIDLLINNAGLAKGFAPIHEGSFEHWETMIDTNLKGLLYLTRLISPGMVRRRKGHIINIGSAAAKVFYPNGNVYCATKAAVEALTYSMRLDLHAHNIRVSLVSPGHVEETEFAITRFDGDSEKARIYEDFQPLKAADVAETIYFIATRPAHVNIQDVYLYGTQQASTTLIDRSGRPGA